MPKCAVRCHTVLKKKRGVFRLYVSVHSHCVAHSRACARRTVERRDLDEDEYRESLLEASREWLKKSREALLQVGLASGKVC